MRPYVENGKTPGKTPKKKTRRGEKAINGVKKSLVKAKVSAVKTKRKLESKDAEEVADLLELTQNGNPETPQGKVLAQKVAKASTPNKQMKKLKSLVLVAAASEGRRSERLKNKSSSTAASVEAVEAATNGVPNGNGHISNGNGHVSNGNGHVEEAIDAMEVVKNGDSVLSNGAGLLQRTMSKIWRLPGGITTGVPYSDIGQSDSPANDTLEINGVTANGDAAHDTTDGKKASCVIS